MTRRITIICDNSVGPISGTLGEHGFAALVELDGESILFDTGQGRTLLHNAARMNKELGRVERVVLSHGHYDHTSGLKPLLAAYGQKEILAHPGVFGRRYRVKDTGESISIGIPETEESLRGLGATFDLSDAFREIASGMYLTGAVPRTTTFETGDSGLFCDEAGCRPDHVQDDQSLAILTDKGIVLLLGCCHAGLINTIEMVRERTGVEEIRSIVGGTHLGFCSSQQLDATVSALRELRVGKIYGGHCTGFSAAARLYREFPGQFHPAMVGTTLEI